jgi:hypothetical protein
VHEHEVVVGQQPGQGVDLLGGGPVDLVGLEAEQPRDAHVHRVGGDGQGLDLVPVGEAGQLLDAVEAAQEQEVAALAAGEQGPGLVEDPADELGGALGLGRAGDRVQRGHALALGVGVGQVAVQAWAAQHQQAAVLALRLEEELGPVELDLADQEVADAGRLLGGQPAGPAVGDGPVGGQGAEVDPGGHVAGLELEADAGRRQGAAADLVFQGVVAEQAEVAGPRAGGDAPGDRVVEPQRALAGQPVEVGGVGLGELRAPLGGPVAAEAVHHQQEGLLALGPCHLGHDGLGGERHRAPPNLRGTEAPESTGRAPAGKEG